jgi:hypothetical protein
MYPWDASPSSEPGHFIVIPQASGRIMADTLEGVNARAAQTMLLTQLAPLSVPGPSGEVRAAGEAIGRPLGGSSSWSSPPPAGQRPCAGADNWDCRVIRECPCRPRSRVVRGVDGSAQVSDPPARAQTASK